ncbi:MAG: DNA polymerase III subunit delta [Rhodanobacteraceae bacterium]|jgi:DNA polymerase-3 subunit delta|nr:DNA polymerase III subunit delta [Rhodanobacteraceae bacterium]
MATSLSAFRKHLTGNDLKPAYLLAGAEHLLVIEAADALRARAKELGYLEREILDVEANFDWNRLADASRSLSLFASRKLIDLRLPSGKPGKDGAAAITEFCAAPPPDTVLLVTANDWSKKHEGAWSAAIERVGALVTVWPLKREELPDWIGARMASRGLKATPDAIALLAERVEGNLLAAAQEVDKLALLHAGSTLDVEALEASVADDARYDVFRLTDAAIGGDAGRALHIVAGLRAEGEEIIPLLGWLLTQLRLLLRLASAPNVDAALRNERIWPQAREGLFRRALKSAGREHWERCLAQAGRIDAIAKGRAPGDAWRELERLIAAIAQPRRAGALIASP